MQRRVPRRLLSFLLLLLSFIALAGARAHAGVIFGVVQDRGGNPLNGAIVEYFRQECGCFATQCGSGQRLIDYTGPAPYGHLNGQFYTINVPPGTYNIKITYQGVGYDNAVTNVPISTCDNSQTRGPYTITLPIGNPPCPYQSLQARVQMSVSDPWVSSRTITRGQSVRVATFRDNTGQLTDCCTTMRFSGPGMDIGVSNLQTVTPPQAGTYTLRSTCGTRSDTATVVVNDPPPSCPYGSIQARVQAPDGSAWAASGTVQRGQTVRVASFHDGSGQLTSCCTAMRFSGPGLDTAVSNLQVITPPQTGTYTLRATCDTRSDTATVTVVDPPPPAANYRFGLNPGALTDLARVPGVVSHFQNLGVGWVRLEIINSRPPSHWSQVVDQFVRANINVLALLSNQTWSGGAGEPRSGCSSDARRFPGPYGDRLVREFLPAADPYVQALKDRVSAWELWNEANVEPGTWLCPENYAYLLVEARLRWPDIGAIGPSLMSLGSGTPASDYLSDLVFTTDKALYWQDTYGDLPWDFLLHHPYPGGEDPENFLPNQAQMLDDVQSQVQSKPIWFTEIGWFGNGGEEPKQADMLMRAYTTWPGVMFWFALYDCVPYYGLIEGCGDPNARRRQAYNAYRRAAGSL